MSLLSARKLLALLALVVTACVNSPADGALAPVDNNPLAASLDLPASSDGAWRDRRHSGGSCACSGRRLEPG